MSTDDLDNLFGKIEEFTKNNKFKPQKTTLAEIGRSCENHTNIVIHSVNKKSNYYEIKLLGKSNGNSSVVIFYNGKVNLYNFSEFNGEKNLKINSKYNEHTS